MNIYFFSTHDPDPQMIQDLGTPIKAQYKGNISNIHAEDGQIVFTETLFIGGQTIKVCHDIKARSIVVIEAPPLLQGSWLDAGVAVLLIPKMESEKDAKGKIVFKYSGLLQIHKIEVVTSEWTQATVTDATADSTTNPEKLTIQ